MKDTLTPLKIFNFSHPLFLTEWFSLLGDKYSSALPFGLESVDSPANAEVILWDGIITAKNKIYVEKLLTPQDKKQIFLILGESMTLMESNPSVKMIDRNQIEFVELPGWNVLPEDMLSALQSCYQKLKNV